MESLLKVDRLDGTFIGSESFQSSQCGDPTQRFMLHRCEPSGSICLKAVGRKPSGECLPIVTRSHPARFIASFFVELLTASSS
jgi:hypothetical protein